MALHAIGLIVGDSAIGSHDYHGRLLRRHINVELHAPALAVAAGLGLEFVILVRGGDGKHVLEIAREVDRGCVITCRNDNDRTVARARPRSTTILVGVYSVTQTALGRTVFVQAADRR